MKKIFIVGGGGFARECHLVIMRLINEGADICFGGFLGHNGHAVDAKSYSNLCFGDLSDYEFAEDDYAVIGVGNIAIRKKIFFDLKARGIKQYTLVCGGSIAHTVKFGEGNIFLGATITSEVSIGDGNLFNGDIIVGHDCVFGSFNFIAPRATFLGCASLGDENSAGTGSVFMPSCKIGSGNKIAPLSVVYRGCKNNCYMLGNPAMKVGDVQNGEL